MSLCSSLPSHSCHRDACYRVWPMPVFLARVSNVRSRKATHKTHNMMPNACRRCTAARIACSGFCREKIESVKVLCSEAVK
jgi:hypothetical protein